MSTEIQGLYGSVIGISHGVDGSNVFVYLPKASVSCKDAGAPRADFLAAVAVECNVIVVDRAELPGIDGTTPGNKTTAESHRKIALHHLALAEYLDAHPPVDEADIEALSGILIDADMDGADGPTPALVARRLLASGKVTVTR